MFEHINIEYRAAIERRYSEIVGEAKRFEFLLRVALAVQRAKPSYYTPEIAHRADMMVRQCHKAIDALDLLYFAKKCPALCRDNLAFLIQGEGIPFFEMAGNTGKMPLEGIFKRMVDLRFWRRVLRRESVRSAETLAVLAGQVSSKKGRYCSKHAWIHRQMQAERNNTLLENTKATNEEGFETNLLEMAKVSTSNKTMRRAEVMTRVNGLEKQALATGAERLFVTLTCPSRMHCTVSATGNENARFDGTTPRQSNQFLGKLWAQIRAQLKREQIEVYGLRVAQPNHDATAHYHFVLFVAPSAAKSSDAQPASAEDFALTAPSTTGDKVLTNGERFEQIVRHYSLEAQDYAKEAKGIKQRRYDVQKIRESATGYVARYVARMTDGVGLEGELFNDEILTEVERADTWCSTWGIRAFQFFGTSPVAEWRTTRRMKEDVAKAAPAVIRELWTAASVESDYSAYLEVQGGVNERAVKALRLIEALPTRYDGIGEKKIIVGLNIAAMDVPHVFEIPRHHWTIEYTPPVESADVGFSREAPCPRINNCTPAKNSEKPSLIGFSVNSWKKPQFSDYTPPSSVVDDWIYRPKPQEKHHEHQSTIHRTHGGAYAPATSPYFA